MPRIISESVIVRGENARPGSSGAPAKTHESRSKPAAKARSVGTAPGTGPRRLENQAVGTRGLEDAAAAATGGAAAATGGAGSVAHASARPATSASPKKTSTSYASMAGGGWLFGLVLAGAVAGVLVYRRRPFRVY